MKTKSFLITVIAILILNGTPLKAEEASSHFHLMLSDIASTVDTHYGNDLNLQSCGREFFNDVLSVLLYKQGSYSADVSLFDPLILSARALTFALQAGSLVHTADYASAIAANLAGSDSADDFIYNLTSDIAILYAQKKAAKIAAGKIPVPEGLKSRVEAGEAIPLEYFTEEAIKKMRSDDTANRVLRQLYEDHSGHFSGVEKIDPYTVSDTEGTCKTTLSAEWHKDRSKIIVTIQSECDCAAATQAAEARGQEAAALKEGSATIFANTSVIKGERGNLIWYADVYNARFRSVCCSEEGTSEVVKFGDYNQGKPPVRSGGDQERNEEEDGRDDPNDNGGESGLTDDSSGWFEKGEQAENEKRWQLAIKNKKVCDSDHKKALDRLTLEWKNKRNQLKRSYDNQLNTLTEKVEDQEKKYKAATKKLAAAQALSDAAKDPSLSYCDDLAKKQERISDDIRFQYERLINAETRRGACRNNCTYLDTEIANIQKAVDDLKSERSFLKGQEERCRKGNKAVEKTLPGLKKQRTAETEKLHQLQRLLEDKKRNKDKALEDIDIQYEHGKAALAAALEDCKKKNQGRFLLPGGTGIKPRLPEPLKLSELKAPVVHVSDHRFSGHWVYGDSTIEFRENGKGISAYWISVGAVYRQRGYKAGEKLIEGTVYNGILTGKYNFKAPNTAHICGNDWSQWSPITLKFQDNDVTLTGTLKDFGLTWKPHPTLPDKVVCESVKNNAFEITLVRTVPPDIKSDPVTSTADDFIGEWTGPKGLVMRFDKLGGELLGTMVSPGSLHPSFAAKPGETYMRGTVKNNILSGTTKLPLHGFGCANPDHLILKFKANLSKDRRTYELQTQAVIFDQAPCKAKIQGWQPKILYRKKN